MPVRRVQVLELLMVLCIVLLGASPAAAQVGASPADIVLIVGTKEAPPFAMRQDDGTWRGLSIDLWRDLANEWHDLANEWHDLANELGLAYELRETDLAGLLQGVEQGTLDVAVAALTVTAERERQLDFTHPYFVSGLGIAVPVQQEAQWLSVLSSGCSNVGATRSTSGGR